MIESWRDVPGYEGLYEVSDWGRVRRNGKILKPAKIKNGYLRVDLYKDGIQRHALLHRIVAQAFIPNPQNLPQVNHKDEDKTNNAVSNLEWCTQEYNHSYGTINERIAEKHSKPVLQYDRLGNFIREWPSALKVEEELGIGNSHISGCCLGKRKSAGGFVWRHKE
jgi:hypothetical protein